MKTLSEQAFLAAEKYLEQNGRSVDRAWFQWDFKGGDIETICGALKAYQWDNGGFGKKLEPDHRTAHPSCYTTCFAFKWFETLGLPGTDEMVTGALSFLKNNFNAGDLRWPAFPLEANQDPHAVWWHFNEGEDLCGAEKNWGLPSAEILGILLKHDPDNESWQRCFEKAVDRLESVYPKMDISEASAYSKMYEFLDTPRRILIQDKLFGILEAIIESDESRWTDYSAKPLMYIQSPQSPLYPPFKELIQKNLDWEIDKQTPEGCWVPNWQWYRDESSWPEARDEWKGYLTVERLVILKRFGRITPYDNLPSAKKSGSHFNSSVT
jgi:hypothetical protein